MKRNNRYAAALLCALTLANPAAALAQQDEICALCRKTHRDALCESVYWTAKPVQTPTPAPTRKPAAQETPRPQVTAKPTAQPTAAPTARPSQSMGDYTTESLSAQEQKAWNLINQDRTANGLAPLPPDSALSHLARLKSRDMAENGYFSHTSPTYGSAADLLRSHGYVFQAVGENIAHHATVEKSQAAFMSSQGHKRNILGKNWTRVGVGVWTDKQGYVYVTQLFAR